MGARAENQGPRANLGLILEGELEATPIARRNTLHVLGEMGFEFTIHHGAKLLYKLRTPDWVNRRQPAQLKGVANFPSQIRCD